MTFMVCSLLHGGCGFVGTAEKGDFPLDHQDEFICPKCKSMKAIVMLVKGVMHLVVSAEYLPIAEELFRNKEEVYANAARRNESAAQVN